jgi:hypothetical protein
MTIVTWIGRRLLCAIGLHKPNPFADARDGSCTAHKCPICGRVIVRWK